MNVDLFQNDSSWIYYLYLSIPLFFVILACYAFLKYKRRMLRAIGHVILRLLYEADGQDTTDAEMALAAESETSETVLRWAASAGRVDIVSSMAKRASVPAMSHSDEKGTPLLWAVRNGHQDIAEVLITKTSDLNATDEDGATALHWAARHGMSKITELLPAKGADMHVKDKKGNKPQAWARKGKDKTLRLGHHASASGWGEDIC
jgi:ankyrin repeat protein